MRPTQATVDTFAARLNVSIPAEITDVRERYSYLDGWDCGKRDGDNGFMTMSRQESIAWVRGFHDGRNACGACRGSGENGVMKCSRCNGSGKA
jgi:hypothetical protein